LKSREHVFYLYLDSPLYNAVIKFQAEKELGRAYATLRIFVEGLKALNLISQDLYEYYKQKYSEPLKPSFILEDKRPKCYICGQPAIHKVYNGAITRDVCSRHLKDFLESGKWRQIE
jgi:hypothetical protein